MLAEASLVHLSHKECMGHHAASCVCVCVRERERLNVDSLVT
jgi:hypothetical protein